MPEAQKTRTGFEPTFYRITTAVVALFCLATSILKTDKENIFIVSPPAGSVAGLS